MNSTEKPRFEERCKVLLSGFNVMPSPERVEAYWTGLGRMQLGIFERCVEHVLGPEAPEKLPTPGQIWRVSKELRAKPEKAQQGAPASEFDKFSAYGNRAMLAWLCKHGQASEESLAQMVVEKNKLCDAYRTICEDEPDACLELREKLFDAFAAAFKPMLQPERARRTRSCAKPETDTFKRIDMGELIHGNWQAESPFPAEFS